MVAAVWGLEAAGIQSDNHVLMAVPAPAHVAIDGQLGEWDLSGRIPVCRDVAAQMGRYSAWVAMMYDRDALYVGVDWCDPTPMVNNYDPRFDVDLRHCFHSDSIQLHLKTDIERKVIGWYYTRGATPAVCVLDGWFPWHDDKPIPYIDGMARLGITEAFQAKADGSGYTQELRIPWAAVVKDGRRYGPGDAFECMLDLVWGPDSGKGWPVNHMMDVVQPGAAHAGWFWEVKPIYGKVELARSGNLALPEPDFMAEARRSNPRLQSTQGPVALDYRMPYDGFATLVIEDAAGRRVRNLIGMAQRAKGKHTDFWDCLDENGRLVSPGTYRFRGLTHSGIVPVYEATYGTPGIPPWDTADGTGAWLSDHCAPRAVAVAGARVILGAERAESGYSLIAVAEDGRKQWGDAGLAGIDMLAADETYAYVFLRSWDIQPALARVEAASGRYAPFATADGAKLKVSPFRPGEEKVWVGGFAAGPETLAVSVCGTNGLSAVRFYDKQTAAIVGELPLPGPGRLAYDREGVLVAWSSGRVVRIRGGTVTPWITRDLPAWADGIAVDGKGCAYLVDRALQQVRVYGTDGRFLRAIGRPGGRPRTGRWDPDGMLNPLGIAVDAQGRLWVAEDDGAPKRISVWTREGRLAREFIGPTQYGGGGANADPEDKTRVFGSGCEFSLDYRSNQAVVVAALGEVAGELLHVQGREYIMSKHGRLYLRQGDRLRPVAAIGNPCVKDLAAFKEFPLPPVPQGTHGYASMTLVWSDLNDDGVAQSNEVVTGSRWCGWNGIRYPVGTSGYFGSPWLDEHLNICSLAGESFGAYGGRPPMVTLTPLKGWTAGGAPRWDLTNQVLIAEAEHGGCLYGRRDGWTVYGAPLAGARDDGSVVWTYKDNWSGVHGSHWAPLPDRDDVLIGTLGCIGMAPTPVGTVFAMHSNMGRLYVMTLDGLLVASVFQDCRLGGDSWPAAAVPGSSLSGVTMGSEWFGGHFFQARRTGEYYLIAGFTAYNMIRLNGFESLKAIPGGTLTVTAGDIAAGESAALSRAAHEATSPRLTVGRLAGPPAFDGRLGGFDTNRFVAWSSGPYSVRAAVAVDATNLYLGYDVSGDRNPMVNGGKDVTQLFATGDSVDLQLGTDAGAASNRTDAAPGDIRLLVSVFDGKPVAVAYRWKARHAAQPVTFRCPWRSCTVDRVEVLADARVAVARGGGGYVVEAAIPLATLGFEPKRGASYRADLGVIFSDAKGDNRAARVYWSNKATGLTADVPGEIMATPGLWGTATVE